MSDNKDIEILGLIRALASVRSCLSYNDKYWKGDNENIKRVVSEISRYEIITEENLLRIQKNLVDLGVSYIKNPEYLIEMIQSTIPTARVYWQMAELLQKVEFRLGVGDFNG